MFPHRELIQCSPLGITREATGAEMRVNGRAALEEFARKHPDVRQQIDSWLCEVQEAKWATPMEVKARYPTASFLAENRVVFNLKGNKYRLDVKIAYRQGIVLIIRIGKHADYSKWQF